MHYAGSYCTDLNICLVIIYGHSCTVIVDRHHLFLLVGDMKFGYACLF
jgi:hypothetical protein